MVEDYIIYALLASVASVIGGLVPIYTKVKEINTNYLIGFASGILMSTALFEMLRESIEQGDSNVVYPLALGFFSLYFVEKSVMIHACNETSCSVHTSGWVGMIGLGLESVMDGIAIAVGYEVLPAIGIIIAIAVTAHEFPVGFSTTVIAIKSNFNKKNTLIALYITSFATLFGALISGYFPKAYFSQILAYTAGTFIYISASDLLPHSHEKVDWIIVFCVILGAIMVPILEVILKI